MRVTMTPPMLANADCVLFLVTGEEKADAAKRAFADPPGEETPASMIRSRDGLTIAVLDTGCRFAPGLDIARVVDRPALAWSKRPVRYRQMRDTLTIDRPEQLKALGHPLRLRVLEELGAKTESLTNRELAQRLGVDPGHLHFHVRMLQKAGLIELADGGQRREKPYRSAAKAIRVAPELTSAGLSGGLHAAMLDEVQRAFTKFAEQGRFRGAQVTVALPLERRASCCASSTRSLTQRRTRRKIR